jgi:hypothetical protein
MACTNCPFVIVSEIKRGSMQNIGFVFTPWAAGAIRVNLKRCMDEMALLIFDPAVFRRLVQPNSNPLR